MHSLISVVVRNVHILNGKILSMCFTLQGVDYCEKMARRNIEAAIQASKELELEGEIF